jgi:hypothetical protein
MYFVIFATVFLASFLGLYSLFRDALTGNTEDDANVKPCG